MSQYSAHGSPLSPSTGSDERSPRSPARAPPSTRKAAFTISGSGLDHPFAVQIDGLRPRLGHRRRPWRRQARRRARGDSRRHVRREHHRHRPRFQSGILLTDPEQVLQMAARPGHRRGEQRLDRELLQQHGHPGSGPTAPSPGYTNCRTGHCHGRRPSMGPAASGWHSFGIPRVWLLCGTDTTACPPGSSTGTVLSTTVRLAATPTPAAPTPASATTRTAAASASPSVDRRAGSGPDSAALAVLAAGAVLFLQRRRARS